MSNDDDYEVGYRRPPKAHQFRKGHSGNPKGRRKGARNLKSDVVETLRAPVPIVEDGKRRSVSTQRALLLRLREKALKGESRALDRCIALAQAYNGEEVVRDAAVPVAEADQAIIERSLARRQTRAETAAPTETTSEAEGPPPDTRPASASPNRRRTTHDDAQ